MKKSWIDEVKFDSHGLIPAIIEDALTHDVLMMAYMNKEALTKTLQTKKAHFYSRSRRKLWLKGESSGHIQKVKRVALDCDGDALLISVSQVGGACHTGFRSCFYRVLTPAPPLSRRRTGGWKTVGKKVFNPDEIYGRT